MYIMKMLCFKFSLYKPTLSLSKKNFLCEGFWLHLDVCEANSIRSEAELFFSKKVENKALYKAYS